MQINPILTPSRIPQTQVSNLQDLRMCQHRQIGRRFSPAQELLYRDLIQQPTLSSPIIQLMSEGGPAFKQSTHRRPNEISGILQQMVEMGQRLVDLVLADSAQYRELVRQNAPELMTMKDMLPHLSRIVELLASPSSCKTFREFWKLAALQGLKECTNHLAKQDLPFAKEHRSVKIVGNKYLEQLQGLSRHPLSFLIESLELEECRLMSVDIGVLLNFIEKNNLSSLSFIGSSRDECASLFGSPKITCIKSIKLGWSSDGYNVLLDALWRSPLAPTLEHLVIDDFSISPEGYREIARTNRFQSLQSLRIVISRDCYRQADLEEEYDGELEESYDYDLDEIIEATNEIRQSPHFQHCSVEIKLEN